MSTPTYKELIQLLTEAEKEAQDCVHSVAELLASKFCKLYPHISVSRPGRFLETVRRIDGPIRSGKLKGSYRKHYLERKWTPRTRNTTGKGVPYMLHACLCLRAYMSCKVID